MAGRFKHMDRVVLVFISLGFLLLVSFSVLVLIKNKTLTHRVYYETMLDSANGLTSNPPIFFKGFQIGRLDDFELVSATNQIRVKFYIYENYAHKIIKYAVISRIESTLLGTSNEYEILLPKLDVTSQPEPLQEGDLVPFINTDLGQIYAKKGRIEQKLTGVDSVLNSVNAVLNSVDAVLINLQKESNAETGELFVLLQKFSTIADSLAALSHEAETSQIIPDVKQTIADLQTVIASSDTTLAETKTTISRMNTLLANAQDVTQHVDRLLVNYEDPAQIISTVTENKVPNTIDNIDRNLIYLENILKEIHLQREQLSRAIISVNKTLETVDTTLEGVNNNPLIKGFLEPDPKTVLSIEINEN